MRGLLVWTEREREEGRKEGRKEERDGTESKDKDSTRSEIISTEATIGMQFWKEFDKLAYNRHSSNYVVHSKHIQGILQ